MRLDGHIFMTVSDNRIDIEEDKQEMIFHKYIKFGNDVDGTGARLFNLKGWSRIFAEKL